MKLCKSVSSCRECQLYFFCQVIGLKYSRIRVVLIGVLSADLNCHCRRTLELVERTQLIDCVELIGCVEFTECVEVGECIELV